MTSANQSDLYPALASFLKSRMSLSGSACSQNVSSSAWIQGNFGRFAQFANFSDFAALNANFSALDALPILTVRQRVSFSLELNASSDPAAAASIVGTLQNTNDLYDFLASLNTGVASKNISSVNAALSQALLNKTFDAIKANISMFNKSDWTQLFQDKLSALLPQISSQQISLIPLNITCDSYQVILNSLDLNFPKMSSGNQKDIYNSLIKPFMTQKGPSCAQNVGSGALIQQNFGKFSQFANYKDFVTLNGNFSGGDVLSSLTMQQVIDYSLDPNINQAAAAGIVGMITDVNTFLASLKTSASLNNVSSLSPYLSQGLLDKSFQTLKPNFNSFSSSDWTQLFQDNISLVLPAIRKDQLNLIPNNINCASYQTIFNSLQTSFSKMASNNQGDVYKYFIRPYLKQKGSAITCYNQSDAKSSAWLVNNVGPFMTYTSEEDLRLFANPSMLQSFANDPSSLQLAKQLNFPKETGIYFTSLLTSSPSFNLSSLPDTFLCYLTPSALTSLNAQTVLDVTKRINKQCYNTSAGQSASTPTADDVQVAISLVSKLSNFTSDTLVNLGQSAVGLSPGQINKINGSDLITSVTTLASVTGWSVGQTKSIMKKLLDSNFKVENLTNLGSLVTGLPSNKLKELAPEAVLNAVKDPQFASKLSGAPPTLQNMFVSQIVAANSTASSVVKNVPASLAGFIPKSLLLFKSEKASLQDVNGKSWSPDQAAMFFDDIVTTNNNYTQISSSVLQGFNCATPNKISNDQVKMLGKAMKTQKVSLTQDQLTCLSRQITKSGYPTDLTSYPPEVFLFLNSTTYSSTANCTDFFTNVGKANISVLPKGSSLRSKLLPNALSCLNISGFSLTDSNVQVLGQLCCDLNTSYIANSSASILTVLSQCQSLSTEQQTSILTLLKQQTSVYGASSTWTTDTLNSLGVFSGFLTSDILNNISTVSFNSWMKSAIQTSNLTRSQFVTIVSNRTPSRSRRATGCTTGNITADNVNDNLLPVTYTAQQLDACLDNDILVNYLSVLSSKIFTNEQLIVLKNKLDALYPSGYPDTILSSLGAITKVCGDADVNKWSIGSVDTFSSLLAAELSTSLATSIIAKYISLGNPINAAALNVIGSQYICLLSSAQLSLITTTAISDAKALDVSACNQSVKDALYTTAKAAYQAQNSQVSIYYNLIKPYLGGAPAADLKSLAAMSPSMDVGTFVKLNPSAVLGLTVSDVKGLLGNNTVDLTTQVSNSVVSNWIAIQKQSDLDTLGLGIQGGIRDVATTTPTTTKTTIKPTSSSTSVLAHGLLVLLAVFGLFALS
ncbi:mesothelin [Hyla sarda]|uniref:mesothelin n=1 Tax=Hyla sarda TaxID=327740 RepID=UPI0024C2AA7A|nr:mesothelin [Hyla sarda]